MIRSRALVAVLLIASLSACSRGSGSGEQSVSPTAARADSTSIDVAIEAAMPPGALLELVPTAGELPEGYAPVEGGAGPLDLGALAELSPDPAAASSALQQERFRDGYAAQFASASGADFVAVVVKRFGDEAGATAHLAREKRESAADTEPVKVPRVGDESFAFTEKLTEGDVTELASVYFRVGDLVWLVETSGAAGGDIELAKSLAATLASRIS